MSRYIDAELLKDRIRYHDHTTGGDRKPTNDEMEIAAMVTIKTLMEFIDRCPQADVAPVRHAHWYHDGSEWKYRYVCSNCGLRTLGKAPSDMPYCMRCGFKMDEGETNAKND